MAKHNKLKNSGLLFELLVRQITTDTLNNKDSEATSILKKYFYNTELLREYKIYNTIATTRNQTEARAGILINACMEAYKKLNKANLKKQKYDLIAEISSHYNIDDFFKAKVDNYKILASTYQLLEMSASQTFDEKSYSDCNNTLFEHIVSKKDDIKDEDINEFSSFDLGTRELVYKMANKNFNEKYETLNESQKGLLKAYINNISTSNNLRKYCNEQIEVIKQEVGNIQNKILDEVRKVKLMEVAKSLNMLPDNKPINDVDVTNILQYFELIKEFNQISDGAVA